MIDLAIVVEGQTEAAFVKRVLAPSLWSRGVSPWPILPGRGQRRRGGEWRWPAVRGDVGRLLTERTGRFCAVLFDYYALPLDWPGRAEASTVAVAERGAVVETALGEDLRVHLGSSFDTRLFLPHIQLHEFEARLFSDCTKLAATMGVDADSLIRIVHECGSPEWINDGVETAPSKRLSAIGRYDKTTTGVTAAERIGLETMRRECPHFASWLARLEQLGPMP